MSRPLVRLSRHEMPRTPAQQLSLQLPVGSSHQHKHNGAGQAARALDRLVGLDRLLSTQDVCRITGKHRCTLHRWMARGVFPKPARQRGQSIGWLRSDVERWLCDRQTGAASSTERGGVDPQLGAGDARALDGVSRMS